ncbi:MAG: hypothetical protein HY027_12525 [Deltaproteobacteria bacterium]|nr:hypothetical protein [Deltaproteobacteria bacterium]
MIPLRMRGSRWSRTESSRQLARLAIVGLALALAVLALRPRSPWSATEIDALRSLWIGSLPSIPHDPSNAVADNPRAAELGRKLFFDSRLSANGYVSCATCHRPDRGFQDGLALGRGVRVTKRRTQPLVGVAYNPLLFWDGRKDSLWSQALEPLESPTEHGGHRWRYARTIAYHYATEYELIFGSLPTIDWTARWPDLTADDQRAVTRVFSNMGKAIAAYERTLLPTPTRFDAYVLAILDRDPMTRALLSEDEIAGLKLFIGTAGCVRCHATPLFTDHRLHNTGVPPADGKPLDRGGADGEPLLRTDEFACKGHWSDDDFQCDDTTIAAADHPDPRLGAFKTPSLRLVANRPPYMHAGQYATLEDVLHHYSTAPPGMIGTSEIQARHFSRAEIGQLVAFLKSLSD